MSISDREFQDIYKIFRVKPSNSIAYISRVLAEAVVRKVIELACKIMNHQKIEILDVQHIHIAIMSLGLRQIEITKILFSQERDDNKTFQDEFEQFNKCFMKFKNPCISANWLLIDNNIPKINKNKIIARYHEEVEQNKQIGQFNVIHDNPFNFLLPQQQTLLRIISHKLEQGTRLYIGSNLNVRNILPFIMNILMFLQPSDNRVQFILQIINSKGLVNCLQYHIHHILAFLLKYKGQYSWQVGLQISQLINYWQFKYPQFHNIFNQIQKDYSSKIMKLAYEVYFRIPPSMHLDDIDIDIDISKNIPNSKRFIQLLNMCWLRFNYSNCSYHNVFAQGKLGLISDDYLESMI